MAEEQERTPGPWLVRRNAQNGAVWIDCDHADLCGVADLYHAEGGRIFVKHDAEANAEFIVLACNNHDALVAALNDTLNMLRAAHIQCGVHHDSNKRVINARALLAALTDTTGGER